MNSQLMESKSLSTFSKTNISSVGSTKLGIFEYVNDGMLRVYGSPDEPLFSAKDVATILGYSNTRKAILDHVDEQDRMRLENMGVPSKKLINNQGQSVVINKRGLLSMFSKCTKHVPESFIKHIKDKYSIDILVERTFRYYPKETETILYIKKAFSGEKYETQYKCGNYKIDLYFPLYRMAVECDENGHKDYNEKKEKNREIYIKQHLNCIFIRYNPDDKEFCIFDVINTIFTTIMTKINKYHYDPTCSEIDNCSSDDDN